MTNLYEATASITLATATLPSEQPRAMLCTSFDMAMLVTRRLHLPCDKTENDPASKLPEDGRERTFSSS